MQVKNLALLSLVTASLVLAGCTNRNFTYLKQEVKQPQALSTPKNLPRAKVEPYFVVPVGQDVFKADASVNMQPPGLLNMLAVPVIKKPASKTIDITKPAISKAKAKLTQIKAKPIKSILTVNKQKADLLIDAKYPAAWQRVGQVIKHSKYHVLNSNQEDGFYFLVPNGKVADGNTILLSVFLQGDKTLASVYAKDGAVSASKSAVKLLSFIQEQLKG